MRVLVVGSHGLIGHAIVCSLAEKGFRVIAVDKDIAKSSVSESWREKAQQLRAMRVREAATDVCQMDPQEDKESFLRLVDDQKPECIINAGGESLASAFSDLGQVVGARMHLLNQFLSIVALESAARYIYISSSMVYGDFREDPLPEDAVTEPKDVYGAMKLGCEYLVRALGYQSPSFDFAILRPSAVYGALDSNERVLVKMTHSAAKQIVFSSADFSAKLDFTHVSDVGAMVARVVAYPDPVREIFNLANGHARSLGEARQILEGLMGTFDTSQQQTFATDIKRPVRGALKMDKFSRFFGGRETRTLEDGLQQLVRESMTLGLLGRTNP